MLIGLSVLYFTFPCAWLAVHLSWAFPIVSGILFVATLINFLLASFMDPGTLHQGAGRAALITRCVVRRSGDLRTLSVSWCGKCEFYCPPLVGHCQHCDACVEEFDHHCCWMKNCVGPRDYRSFLGFVLLLVLHELMVLISSTVYLALNVSQPFTLQTYCTVFVMVPISLFLLEVLLLLICHVKLISSAEKAYNGEFFDPDDGNPFKLGCKKNWYKTLCAPAGPRYMCNFPKYELKKGEMGTSAPLQKQEAKPQFCASCCHSCLNHKVEPARSQALRNHREGCINLPQQDRPPQLELGHHTQKH